MKKLKLLITACSILSLSLSTAVAQIKKTVPNRTLPAKESVIGSGKKLQTVSTTFTKAKLNQNLVARFLNPSKTRVLSDGTKLTTTMFIKAAPTLSLKQSPGVVNRQERNVKKENNESWLCESSQIRISLDDNSFMNAANEEQSQHIYPGAIYTFDNFFNGSFLAEKSARNPIRISSSAAGITGDIYEDIADPTQPSNIKNAVNKLYTRMPSSNAISGYTHTLYECNSAADMALKIGGGASGYGVSANFSFTNNKNSERRYFMIDATQEMYSLHAEMPQNGLFENSADAAKANLMMMGTVTYGQRVLVAIETIITSQDQGMKFDAKYSGFGASANADLNTFLKETTAETTVKMYIVGGTNQGFVTLDKNTLINKLNSFFANTNVKNAKPIRYQFRNMNNEVIVSQSGTDFFPVRQCVPNDANKNYKVTVTLKSVQNSTNLNEKVKLGLSQWVDARVNGNAIKTTTGESSEIVCWWEKVCEEPRMLTSTPAMIGKSRSFQIKQGDVMNGAYIDIWTKYIAMYSTNIGGKTNSKLDDKGFQHDKVFLKDVAFSKDGKGAHMEKKVDVNLNGRVFTMLYSISMQ